MSGVFLLGLLLTGGAFYDFLRTTISLRGLGPFSWIITCLLWRGLRRLAPWTERRLGLSIRGSIGPTILAAIAASWIVLHLAGYTAMYQSALSLQHSEAGTPATFIETVAFAGSALSTLGASTVTPTNGWWDALSMIAAINGMIVLTLSVSFILNILQTTGAARTLAARYHALAEVAEQGGAEQVGKLGPELVKVSVDLATSRLSGVFVPADLRMSFPDAVLGMCSLLEKERARGKREMVELREGLRLLGALAPGDVSDDLDAARAWAQEHSLGVDGAGGVRI